MWFTEFAGNKIGRITTPRTATHDFNHDFMSDILFRNSGTGAVTGWLMNGNAVAENAIIGTVATHWQIVAQRDFNGDGKSDILWRDNSTGAVVVWLMNGLQVTQSIAVGTVASRWVLVGASDFTATAKLTSFGVTALADRWRSG